MQLSISRRGVGLICACLMSAGPLASPSEARLTPGVYESLIGFCGHGYGYGASYPATYTAGYGGYGYGAGYGGSNWLFGGMFGYSQPYYAGYAPSYASYGYAPASYYSPSCGTGSCGVSGYGISNFGCNDGCSSGLCGSGSCGGVGLCGTSGCGTGDCSSGDCGFSSTPYSAEPVPDDRSSQPNSQSPPPIVPSKTYREQEDNSNGSPGGQFFPPEQSILPGDQGQGQGPNQGQDQNQGQGQREPQGREPGLGSQGSDFGVMPPSDLGEPAQPPPGDGNTPPNDGSQFNYKIPARNPESDEPTPNEEGESNDEGDSVNDTNTIEPLHIEAKIAYRVVPERQRAHYRAIYRTPTVVRTDVKTGSGSGGWTPIRAETKLATTR